MFSNKDIVEAIKGDHNKKFYLQLFGVQSKKNDNLLGLGQKRNILIFCLINRLI
jgi:hypothetical protein